MVSDENFIFHMCIPCDKTFSFYKGHPSSSKSNINVKFFSKQDLTLAITFEF